MFLGNRRSVTVSLCVLSMLAMSMLGAGHVGAQSSSAAGGFMDSATAAGLRPRLSSAQMQTFLPSRGKSPFPAPYGTEGARITNASDCAGADCVHSVGYSYWANINNHVGSDTMLIFLGLERR